MSLERYMRYNQSKKMEVIRVVEDSPPSITQTLRELLINRSTFYDWYRRYKEGGYDGLASQHRPPRELAWHITDKQDYYISESTVYLILKAHDLVTSPVYNVITALEKFPQPTKAVNKLWQTDFT